MKVKRNLMLTESCGSSFDRIDRSFFVFSSSFAYLEKNSVAEEEKSIEDLFCRKIKPTRRKIRG